MANNLPNGKTYWLVAWTVLLIGAYYFLGSANWQIHQDLHTTFETSATVIALFISVILLTGYRTNRDRLLLFLGIGFLGTAALDANHAVVTSSLFTGELLETSGESVVWNWNSSRLFLSILMFLSCWKSIVTSAALRARRISKKAAYVVLGASTLSVVVIFAVFPVSNPYAGYFSVGRAIELPPAIFFLTALIVYLYNGGWKTDTFKFWLILFLISSFFYQTLFMVSSQHLFDTMFVSAHLLKLVSYIFVFVGLIAYINSLAREAKIHSEEINRTNLALQKEIAEKNALSDRLKSAAISLEEKVRERTRELEDSQIAAFNMMEDANEAKELAEMAREELDIQARKLARSNIELEQFAYVASHDLQEPLRTVGSFVQLLAQRYKGKLDEQADEYVQFIVEGVTRMRQLINDLLMFSRVETRGGKFVQTDCEVVLSEVLSDLKSSIDASQAVITHDQMPLLIGDKVQLSQVFQNLIGNAIKFRGKEPPRIHVGVKKQNAEWLFTVQDNGIGFDPEFSEKIFVIFQRLHTRAEYPGTGIGLSLCKKIVERHGGKIWVDSAAGRGTTFNFTLPDKIGEQYEHRSYEPADRDIVGRR